MNHQKRRIHTKQADGQHYINAGHAASKQRKYAQALENYIYAIEVDPKNHGYKLILCGLLKNISFNQFNPKIKAVLIKLLNTQGIDYQDLWKPWLSIILTDPVMKEFNSFTHQKDVNETKFKNSLRQPLFLDGLKKIICLDVKFERALKRIKLDIDNGEIYPKAFCQALEKYCENTEYVFCEIQKKSKYEIDKDIQSLNNINDKISSNVRKQYEKNPYPRWISCNMFERLNSTKEPYDHLIAGCGTGYGLCMTATRFPEAKITAIDLSLASLTYAKSKTKEFKFDNIDFYQADILNLKSLDKKFDIIECSGVLHHMEDPEIGWKSLIKKLKPNGKMNIGLYSELGRQDVVAARKLIKENKLEATYEGIREARELIMSLPENHPAYPVIMRRDFYSTSSCRDLIFHVQEHRFTIQQLKETLSRLNLEFRGFNVDTLDIVQRYQRQFSEDKQGVDLNKWQIFEEENPDTFRGMYQFWCVPAKN